MKLRRLLPILILLVIASQAGVAAAEDEEYYESNTGPAMKRFQLTFLSTGTQFPVDEWRDDTFSFGMAMTMSMELNACPGLAVMLQVKVLYLNLFTSFEVVPFTFGLKLRFPLAMDPGDWFKFSDSKALTGFTPYLRISGGAAYAGAFGDPTSAGWFEYKRYRESSVLGGAVGFSMPLSKNAFIFLEIDYFALMAPHELPVNFLGPIAGISYAF